MKDKVYKVVLKLQFSRGNIWEVFSDRPVKTAADALHLIQQGMLKGLTCPKLNGLYKSLLLAHWEDVEETSLGNYSVRATYPSYHGEEDIMTVKSYLQDFIKV